MKLLGRIVVLMTASILLGVQECSSQKTWEDTTYNIEYFLLSYDSQYGDIWEKVIFGNRVTIENAPILKNLRKGELLEIGCIKLKKGKSFYTMRGFAVITSD